MPAKCGAGIKEAFRRQHRQVEAPSDLSTVRIPALYWPCSGPGGARFEGVLCAGSEGTVRESIQQRAGHSGRAAQPRSETGEPEVIYLETLAKSVGAPRKSVSSGVALATLNARMRKTAVDHGHPRSSPRFEGYFLNSAVTRASKLPFMLYQHGVIGFDCHGLIG